MEKAAAEKTKLVLFSPAEDVTVTIDGGDPVEVKAGRFKEVPVKPGKHELLVGGEREILVEVEAFDRWAVPLVADQCFMSIDVSLSHYSADNKKALGGPDITKRRQTSEAFKFPPHHYLVESELPQSRSSAQQSLLLRSLPCEQIDALEKGVQGGGNEAKEGTGESQPVVAASDPITSRFVDAEVCKAPDGVTESWCTTGKEWAASKAGELPEEGVYLGLSLALRDQKPLLDALAEPPLISVFAVARGDAPAASLTTLKGDNDKEQAQVEALAASVQSVLAGKAESLEVDEALASYLKTLPTSAEDALTQEDSGWTFDDVVARPVGPYWVTTEPFEGGTFFSVHVPFDPTTAPK